MTSQFAIYLICHKNMWPMPGVVPSLKKSILASTNALISRARQKTGSYDKREKPILFESHLDACARLCYLIHNKNAIMGSSERANTSIAFIIRQRIILVVMNSTMIPSGYIGSRLRNSLEFCVSARHWSSRRCLICL